MLAAFSFEELAEGFGILSIIVFVLILFFRRFRTRKPGRYGLSALIEAAVKSIGICGLILTTLNFTQVWRVFWAPNSILHLNKLVFPHFHGKWTGPILTNGPQPGYRD